MTPAARTRGGRWRTLALYVAVAVGAALANEIVRRGGLPAWVGYSGSAMVVVVAVAWIESRRRAARLATDDPDLQLFHAEAPRARIGTLLATLERAERPRAGVGVAIPPGECKLWIRHAEGGFEIHVFSVAATDAAQLAGIVERFKRTAGIKPAASGAPQRVHAFRAALDSERIMALVDEVLDLEPAPAGTPVRVWWSMTLGE